MDSDTDYFDLTAAFDELMEEIAVDDGIYAIVPHSDDSDSRLHALWSASSSEREIASAQSPSARAKTLRPA